MDKEQVKDMIEKEMGSTLNENHSKIVEGLIQSYQGLHSIGLDSLSVMYRCGIETSLKEDYHSFLGKTRKEELSDKLLLSVFCLVLSRPDNITKLKI